MATNNAINLTAAGLARYDGAGTFTGVTVTQHDLLIGAATNGITSLALINGQLAIGNTGNDPTAATITPGTGINITNGAGSITIAGVGGGLTWTVITASTQAAAINNGYACNYAGTLVVTLPAVSAVGTIVAVTGINPGNGWQLAQNAGNQIFFGTSTSTSGATGYLQSTNTYDTVYVLCVTTSANWVVVGSIGNLTVH